MLKIRMERHLNSCFHREDTRTFDTFAELEEWIFDQMQQDYTGCKMTLRFPTSEIAQCFHDNGPCRIEIHPTPDGEQLWIHQIETPEGIIFSDGRYTAGKKFWTQEVQTWLTHCEQRRLNPQFNLLATTNHPSANCGRGSAFPFTLPQKRKRPSSEETKKQRPEPFER